MELLTNGTYRDVSRMRWTSHCCTAISEVNDGKNHLDKRDDGENNMDRKEWYLKIKQKSFVVLLPSLENDWKNLGIIFQT